VPTYTPEDVRAQEHVAIRFIPLDLRQKVQRELQELP